MKIFESVLILITFVGFSVSANATLVVIDDDLVWDTSINMYFQRDWLAYTGLTYNEMKSSINDSTVGGFTDWRLTDFDELKASSIWDFSRDVNSNSQPTELADIFEPSQRTGNGDRFLNQWEGYTSLFEPSTFVDFGGVKADHDIESALIAGSYSTEIGNDMHNWDTFHMSYHRTNEQLDSLPLPFGYGAWVVSSGAVSVPEPSTILLFGFGLVGLVGARFRKKKKQNSIYQ